MTTLSQIAERAGVSVATVSNVLNGTKAVREETRRRVEQAASELGYSPSRFARGLKTGKSSTIGMIVPDLTNPFFPAIVQAAEAKARELGYGLIIVDCRNDPEEERQAFALISEYRADGLIWIPVREAAPRHSFSAPIVTMDRPVAPFDSVSADHRAGGRLIGAQILAAGRRFVGVLQGPAEHFSARERHAGLLEGLGGALAPAWTLEVPFSLALTAEARQRIADTAQGCIVCANDQVAVSVLRLVQSLGRRVPQDVAVIGFDDIAWADFSYPRLTTVRQPYGRLGTGAVELLLRRMANPKSPRQLRLLPVEWIARESFPG
ncbi:MAG: LacI family DNA-binding transcriptional regulator [Kiloniellales bacterium]